MTKYLLKQFKDQEWQSNAERVIEMRFFSWKLNDSCPRMRKRKWKKKTREEKEEEGKNREEKEDENARSKWQFENVYNVVERKMIQLKSKFAPGFTNEKNKPFYSNLKLFFSSSSFFCLMDLLYF